MNSRDRFVPRDDIFHLSLRACEAISLFGLPALNTRDCHVFRDDNTILSKPPGGCDYFVIASEAWQIPVIASEAWQSLFSGYLHDKGEIATFLAMTSRFVKAPSGCCERNVAISLLSVRHR